MRKTRSRLGKRPGQTVSLRAHPACARLSSAPSFYASLATTTAIAALLAAHPAFAAPTGGTVVGGSATISTAGATTNINQSTNSAIINWMGFSIASGETVNFFQPSPMSVTLNRVIGNEQSIISGALNANGQVFIVNSAGVIFTKGAQVNVGGIVASTQDISNQDFMAGNYAFSGTSQAAIINKGHINAAPGGYVALLGKTVKNDGVISAKLGTVALASGEQMTINFGGNSLVDVTIDKGTYNALVANKGLIKADGGTVIMSAKAADAVLSAQVNNTGIIEARTIGALTGGGSGTGTVHVGTIKLLASGGTVKVAGKLDASAPKGGKGGTIETSGNTVKVASNAVITTKSATGQNGNWIIDPDGFTIAATGGDITGAKLSSELASNNISILSTQGSGNNGANDGNLNVNDVVSWTSTNTLSLTATNAIYVNAVITAPNGTLNLTAGTDINVNAPSSLQVATLNATAAGNVTIAAPQTWANNGNWTFNATNINVDDTVNWSNGTLTFNAGYSGGVAGAVSGYINVNAPMTASNNASFVATYNTGMDTSTDGSGNPTATYGTPLGGFNFLFQPDTPATATTAPVAPTPWTFIGNLDFVNSTAANPLIINGNSYTLITSIGGSGAHDLSVINTNGGIGYYALASNLTSTTTYTSAVINSLGSTGILEGLGNRIDGITVASASFGTSTGSSFIQENLGTVRDLNLTNISVTNDAGYTGSLAGSNSGNILNVYAQGSVTVTALAFGQPLTLTGGSPVITSIGGLVGFDQGGVIYGSQANVNVTTSNATDVGGFVGTVYSGTPTPVILDSVSWGAVNVSLSNQTVSQFNSATPSGPGFGGFAGTNEGVISNSASVGAVTATALGSGVTIYHLGGFAGVNGQGTGSGGVINNSVSYSNVTTTPGGTYATVGGFVGLNFASTINNSSVHGLMTLGGSASQIGGFAGRLFSGTFTNDLNAPAQTGESTSIGRGSSSGVSTTTDTIGSPDQGPPPNNSAQNAANARQNAQTLYNAATAQQQAVAQAAAQVAAQAAASAAAQAQLLRDAAAGADASMGVTQISAITPPDPEDATAAGKEQISALHGPNTDDNLSNPSSATTPVPTGERRRHADNVTPHRKTGGGGGAAIRRIEINGERFDLEKTR